MMVCLSLNEGFGLGNNTSLQQSILKAMHSSAIGGHSGFPVTYHRIKQLFAWPGMRKSVHAFVSACFVCQQAKPERVKYPGLLQPLPVPAGAWQTISMDFVEGLPFSGGKNCVLVVVDKFSKFSHFIPMKHPFTAASVAKVFMQHVYRLHGMPSVIISDRDKIFTSQLWKALFSLAGVTFSMSSVYHPQSDGQTERVNRCMETFLRCFVNVCPGKWVDWIYLAEHFNIIPVGIQLLVFLHLSYCIGTLLSILALTLSLHALFLLWVNGCKKRLL